MKRPTPGATCRITHCQLWPHAALPFCHTHAKTWKVNGRPDIDEFARRFDQISLVSDTAGLPAATLDRREPWGVWGGELFALGFVVPASGHAVVPGRRTQRWA